MDEPPLRALYFSGHQKKTKKKRRGDACNARHGHYALGHHSKKGWVPWQRKVVTWHIVLTMHTDAGRGQPERNPSRYTDPWGGTT